MISTTSFHDSTFGLTELYIWPVTVSSVTVSSVTLVDRTVFEMSGDEGIQSQIIDVYQARAQSRNPKVACGVMTTQ